MRNPNSFDSRRWRRELDRSRSIIVGDNPNAVGEDAKQAMRLRVAEMIRQFYDAGFDPMVLIEMCIAGACFVGDNHGVSRQQIAKACVELQLREDRELIFTPG